MVDTETGEFTEKTMAHEGNNVGELYAALEKSGGGYRSHRMHAMVSGTAGGVGHRVPGGTRGKDPSPRNAEVETGSAGMQACC